ncbi:MAG: response regulator [Nitrospinae bacterium]|nr:response regulator [Nitrospinota bacterium]
MSESKKRILIIDDDPPTAEFIQNTLKGKGYLAYYTEDSKNALDIIYNEPPDLIIIDIEMPSIKGDDLCRQLKGDTVYGHLPVILLIPSEFGWSKINWDSIPADDYIIKPVNPDDLNLRVSLSFSRSARELDANPLTRLPGNNSIMKEGQKRIDLGKKFALAYIDLDNFKPYNDKYGFSRGDEILRMTARVVTNAVRDMNHPDKFVGHVGGDDFVFIVPADFVEGVCEQVIKYFDLLITTFYDEEDRVRGYMDSVNRKGEKERFPIMTVSIAVVTNEKRNINHLGEASAIAADLKKYAKSLKGSKYVKDLRG